MYSVGPGACQSLYGALTLQAIGLRKRCFGEPTGTATILSFSQQSRNIATIPIVTVGIAVDARVGSEQLSEIALHDDKSKSKIKTIKTEDDYPINSKGWYSVDKIYWRTLRKCDFLWPVNEMANVHQC
jgi:hypothetical protein